MFVIIKLSIFIFLSFLSITYSEDDIGKLPYCLENFVPGLALVSTIDGKLSAVNTEGILQWQVETGPGPLLTSNIHNLELTNSGKWIRIIPSLTGTLYRFDGLTIDPIPISADSLLKSSFKYSDDLVIAGGLDIRTYGIGFRSGKIFYTCSSERCTNTTNQESEVDDILLLERSTQTVRAIEPQSGHERWNFSVGHHNIKLPQVSCIDRNAKLNNWNLTAIIPDGLLLASSLRENVEVSWQYHFPSPIVKVWKWDGRKISEVNLFSAKGQNTELTELAPSIYIGMHKKQLYIHESNALLSQYMKHGGVTEVTSLSRIPWKPVSASGLLTEDDSTALSVLYSSEYVNGHGYYLYSESDIKQKDKGLCSKNTTSKFPSLENSSDKLDFTFLIIWWKEIFVLVITTALLLHYFMFETFTRKKQNQNVIFVERHVEVPVLDRSSSNKVSESSEGGLFNSRFVNDFDTLHCLGKGGFGVVFEVKQKIDECHYAIKRIVLPNEQNKRKAVMREVKALAKLEHHNIVRYFTSWVEEPPYGWQRQHDGDWIECDPVSIESGGNDQIVTHFENSKSVPSTTSQKVDPTINKEDSFIVFAASVNENNKENNTNSINSEDASAKTDLSVCTETVSKTDSPSSVNWKRPGRRYHCLNDIINPPVFLYIQMQLCQKKSLKEWLVDNEERDFSNVLNIFKQIISAVEYVHLQGLIHRDLKPSNIFFSLDGQIKVGDFGLVKDCEDPYDIPYSNTPVRGHTKQVGTRLYMSPEQLNGKEYNYKVDIYSLGLIFYELLVYFSTEMERIDTLIKLRESQYPNDFISNRPEEYKLLTMMLCQLPENRLTTLGIRARPPINWKENYDTAYDFELPKSKKRSFSTD